TGLGAVTPLGPDLASSWRRLLAGESGAGALTAFPPDGHPVRIACEASEFEPERWLDPEALDQLDRVAHFAVAAARMAEAGAVHRLRGLGDGDRRRLRRDPARAGGRHALRRR